MDGKRNKRLSCDHPPNVGDHFCIILSNDRPQSKVAHTWRAAGISTGGSATTSSPLSPSGRDSAAVVASDDSFSGSACVPHAGFGVSPKQSLGKVRDSRKLSESPRTRDARATPSARNGRQSLPRLLGLVLLVRPKQSPTFLPPLKQQFLPAFPRPDRPPQPVQRTWARLH